jgi:low molecular weight protein-tyrosine phosphatase
MTGFRILFVCVGNVCRSPLGERLLAARLPADRFEVSSAGVGALVGAAMDPEAAAHLEAYGASADGFVARQLIPSMVKESNLVLTATKAIRSRVLEEAPAALRRTFTVLEFVARLEVVASDGDPVALVRAAAGERSRAALEEYDISDPFRRGSEAHAAAAEQMAAAVERIAKALSG